MFILLNKTKRDHIKLMRLVFSYEKKTIFLKILRYIKVIYIFVPYLIKKMIK